MKLILIVLFVFVTFSAQAQLEQTETSYQYDNLNRLIQVIYNDGTEVNYTYDDLGNRLTLNIEENQGDDLTYVPDDAFEQRLIDSGLDDVMDDYVITNNINSISNLNISNLGVQDMTGIQDFEALETLSMSGNLVAEMDISQNLELISLFCYDNLLESLDITQNILLEILNCDGNTLTELNVTQNSNLTSLDCFGNNLTELDVTQNPELFTLICEDNQLVNLDISQNPLLNYLDCANNSLAELDTSQNINLESLQCGFNNISSIDVTNNVNLDLLNVMSNNLTVLDVSQNPLLTRIACYNNELNSLDLSNNPLFESLFGYNNNFSSLDFSQNPNVFRIRIQNNALESLNVKNGNNEVLNDFRADSNPSLFCIQVDNENAANSGDGVYVNWNVDVQVEYSENCDVELTFVPDDAFEQRLINLGLDDILDDYVVTGNISNLTALNLDGTGVIDLTGIEDFVSLEILEAGFNSLEVVDLSSNNQLTEINLRDNDITEISLGSTQFTFINLDENELTNFDPSIFPDLNYFSIRNNNLTSINFSGLTNLDLVILRFNNISGIDLSDSNLLTHLDVQNNVIEELDLINQNILDFLLVNDNELTLLNLKSGGNNELTTVQAENNPNLLCIEVDNEVDANNGNGVYGGWSKDDIASYSQDCDAFLGIETNTLTNISVYPNPTDVVLNLSFGAQYTSVDLEIKIVNVLGQKVYETNAVGSEIIQVPLDNLESGSYFITVYQEGGSWSQQFIKE